MKAAAVAAASGILLAVFSAPVAASAADASCRTVPVDVDPVLHSDEARDSFSVDGTGVKVGIISDSFDTNPTNSTLADNVADGLLPGAGNPCGYLQPVDVVLESPVAATDEGRAMAQMVHGVAPGASLFFASAGEDEDDLHGAVDALVDAGVTVIIDDVILDGEPFFQESLLSQRIATLRDQGITYLTAAGNATAVALKPDAAQSGIPLEPGASVPATPLSGWTTTAYRAEPCTFDVTDPNQVATAAAIETARNADTTSYDCLDFDPGAGVDIVSTITTFPAELATSATQPSVELPMIFQWGEPWKTAAARFEMFVTFDGQAPQQLEVDEPGLPLRYAEGLTIDLTGHMVPGDLAADAVDMDITIVRYLDGTAATDIHPAVGFVSNTDGYQWALSAEWWRSQGPDNVGATIVAHNGAPAAITVAATGAFSGGVIEPFSSLGPVRYTVTPERADGSGSLLDTPVVVAKPNILSVDGARQTVLSDSGIETEPGVWLFGGTSAATPTAAGVVALALQLDPTLTPVEISTLLASTATPWASPYQTVPAADAVGAGLINALALLQAVDAALPVPEGATTSRMLAASGFSIGSVSGALVLGVGGMALGAVLVVVRRRGRARG